MDKKESPKVVFGNDMTLVFREVNSEFKDIHFTTVKDAGTFSGLPYINFPHREGFVVDDGDDYSLGTYTLESLYLLTDKESGRRWWSAGGELDPKYEVEILAAPAALECLFS